MLQETNDTEEIIARVAALDIGKAQLTCYVRVPTAARRLDHMHRRRRVSGVRSVAEPGSGVALRRARA